MDSAERSQQAKPLFLELVDLSPDERVELLTTRCGEDEKLRAEVETLLAAHDSKQQLIEGNAFGVLIDPPPPGIPDRLIGQCLGRYRILRRIGEGGTSFVYEAKCDSPRRTVALKVIKPGKAASALLARFEHEAKVLGFLDHPGIARVYEAGTGDTVYGRLPYFALELIAGRPLTEYAEERDLTISERLGLLATLCDAVHHAHQKGVIHRDLKPGNILVNQSGQLKVLDFGVARVTDSDLQLTTLATATGQLIGTLHYMSPEQVNGSIAQIDTRSDIYALGVIGYELLSGKLPYKVGKTPIIRAARVIAEQNPTPLSSLTHTFRGDVDTIIHKALEKDKEQRYQSASNMAADIRHYLDGEPIIARPTSAAYKFRRFAACNKVLVGGLAALFVVITTAAVWMTALYARASREAETTTLISEFLCDSLSTLGSYNPHTVATDMRLVLDEAMQRIETELEERPEVEAKLRATIGEIYFHLDEYEDAELQLSAALRIMRRVYGEEHEEIAACMDGLANVRYVRGRHSEAKELGRRSLRMRRKLLGDDHESVAKSSISLSGMFVQLGEFDEAERLQHEALATFRKRFGNQHKDVARALGALGGTYSTKGDFREAERWMRESLAIYRELLGDGHVTVARAMSCLGMNLNHQGKLEEAEALHRRSLVIHQEVYGNDHPIVAARQAKVAGVLWVRGKYAEAEEIYREVVAVHGKQPGEDSIEFGRSVNSLGVVLRDQGKYDEAETLLRQALTIRRDSHGEESRSVAFSKINLGWLYYAWGDHAQAQALFREALTTHRTLLPEGHPDLAEPLMGLGLVTLETGNAEDARSLLREALDIRRSKLQENHWLIGQAESALGACLTALEEYGEAEVLLLDGAETIAATLGDKHKLTLETRRRLVDLYEAWDRPKLAAEWRARLPE